MRNIIFEIYLSIADKTKGFIKFLQVELRTNADCIGLKKIFDLFDTFLHEFFSDACFTRPGGTYYPADRRFTIGNSGRKQS